MFYFSRKNPYFNHNFSKRNKVVESETIFS